MTTTRQENFQSFLDNTTKHFKEVFEKSPQKRVVDTIMDTLADLNERFSTMSERELIDIAGKLSINRSFLGEHTSFMNFKTNTAYVYKKFRRADKRTAATDRLEGLGMKTTQDNIEAEVIKMTLDEEIQHISQQYYTDKCKALFDSLTSVLSAISWRLRDLQEERRDIRSHSSYGKE